jgi:hypothetical protein
VGRTAVKSKSNFENTKIRITELILPLFLVCCLKSLRTKSINLELPATNKEQLNGTALQL